MPCLYDGENDWTEENDERKGVIVDADLVAEKRREERVHEGRGWPRGARLAGGRDRHIASMEGALKVQVKLKVGWEVGELV